MEVVVSMPLLHQEVVEVVVPVGIELEQHLLELIQYQQQLQLELEDQVVVPQMLLVFRGVHHHSDHQLVLMVEDLVVVILHPHQDLLHHLILVLDQVVVEPVDQELMEMVVQVEHTEMMDQQDPLLRVLVEVVVELAVPVVQMIELRLEPMVLRT